MKAVFEQITEFELQKISLKSCNEKTEKDADKCSKDPEGKKDIQLLGTDNKLWKAVKGNIEKIQKTWSRDPKFRKKTLKKPANWAVLSFS